MSGDECDCTCCKPKATEVQQGVFVVGKSSSVFTVVNHNLTDATFTLCNMDHQEQIDKQRACIDELLGLIGYLPQGLAVLEKHGVSR